MKFRGLALCAILCLAGFSSIARADDRKDIEALYHKVEKAMMAKDVKGIMATGTKDFTYTGEGQTMTGDKVSAQMQQRFQMMQGNPTCKFTIISCKIKGKTATVVSSDTTAMTIAMQDGKPHKIVTTGKSTDAVVKTNKGWLMKSVTITDSKMTMDGKPFTPPAPGAGGAPKK